MSEEMRMGMLIAYQAVFEEISTIKAELKRKGFEEPKGFSLLEGFVEDGIKELNWDLEENQWTLGRQSKR